jgi:hypothetical protein
VSEHGKADAVDIGAFVTARGQAALIISDWGPTARQIAAEVAAAGKSVAAAAQAKAPIDQTRKDRIVPVQGGLAWQGQSAQRPATAAGMMPLDLKPSAPIGVPGITLDVSRAGDRSPAWFGFAPPSQLGGPKPQAAAEDPTTPADGKTDFLRAAHRSACRVFNTVLGPEANNAHLNHFHLDMAERINNTKICE